MEDKLIMAWWKSCRHSWRQPRIIKIKSGWSKLPALISLLMAITLMSGSWLFAVPVAAQQSATGTVSIVTVDDLNFPNVALFLDVADANGAAVAGLAPANFAVQEDGQPATVQSVIPDSSQPLALLLALDRSTDPTTWAAVQGAAAAVISALGPQDQVAITSVFEEVQPVVDFTADKDAALAALAAVAPGGQFSAINPAFIDAANRFGDNLPARRAIMMVADAPDNISTVTADDVVAQVTGRGTPIYVVGYGDRVQAEPTFSQIATATGGRFFPIATANELQSSLTALLPQLRQGYRVDFVSTIPADNLAHTAQVQVTSPTVNGADSAQFIARPSTINVTLPGLVAGQPVAGVVNLTAGAVLSGTVASVEFLVDGVPVGSATDLTTPVVWDTSTLTPGPHQLTVVVTDSVGNQGEATVEILIPESAPRLDLLKVDSSLFPKVTTFVDAIGNNGLPLAGLNAQSFTVSEDNQPVDPAQVAVAVDATQPLNVVLVLDRSVPVADWAQLRNGANNLIDTLRPQDEMAIYSFAGSPTLVQAATGDKNTLKSALAAVEAAPPAPATTPPTPSTDNGLHQALLDATNFAETLPEGRNVVVAVTNGADNSGQIGISDLISTLEAQSVPVHVLGYGVDGQSAGTLAAIAQLAGGNSVTVNSATDIRSALQSLALLLQQGYRLDYTSALQADNTPHALSVGLAAGGMNAETASEFTAVGRPITVTFPNVVDGTTASGAMNLTAQADAPAPITSVVYRLNDDILAEVADTTFSIVWNSDTVEPGEYTVVAEVTDAAGNQGTGEISFTVVAPVTVAATLAPGSSDGPIEVGDDVTVNAEASAFSGEPVVEFYVNDTLVNTDRQAPFSATFDSTDFGPGDHEIRAVARDDGGHEATSAVAMTLVAPPVPTPQPTPTVTSLIPAMPTVAMPALDWWRILRWIAIAVIALTALFIVLTAFGSARKNANEQKQMPMRLTLANMGNVATGYLLKGDDPAGILSFRFSLNGVALGLPPVARLTNDSPAPQSAAATGRPPFGNFQMPAMPQGNPQAPNGESGSNVDDVMGKLDEASGVARIILEIINGVAMFLPYSMSRPLRQIATQIRRGQMFVSRAKRVRNSVDKLNQTEMGRQVVQGTSSAAGQVGRAATSEATRSAVAQGANQAGAMVTATAVNTGNRLYDLSGQGTNGGQAGSVPQAGGNRSAVAVPAGARQWVYLPPINPGETVTIQVMVGASGRNSTGEHQPFRILSRALGDENAQPVIEEGSIKMAKTSPWPSLLRFVVAGLVILVAVAMIWLLATSLF